MIAQRITERVNNNKNQEQSPSLKRYIKEAMNRFYLNKSNAWICINDDIRCCVRINFYLIH